MTKDNLVSVIIPAYNEGLVILKCLKSLTHQDYKNIEIIVIDDQSTDNTSLIVRELIRKENLKIKILKNKIHQERSKSRNRGAKISKGKFLLFIDADMYLSNNVVSSCVRLINTQAIKAVIIPEESVGSSYWARCRHLEKKCYLKDNNIEAARFFEKRAFFETGGWDTQMISGEDWDLTRKFRQKYKIGRINSKILHDEGRLTILQIIRKKFYYASKMQVFLKRYPLTLSDIILFIFRPAYFRNWRLFLLDPIHGFGIFVLKIVEILAGGSGFIYSKFSNYL